MGAYRLYFLSRDGRVIAAEVFDAPNDEHAELMAVHLADACSDECDGFELWQGARRLTVQGPLRGVGSRATPITRAMEESIIQREEHIQRSNWRISRSLRLLSRINELRNGQKARS